MKQLNYVENNVAWRWQIEQLETSIIALKNILVKSGILENIKEHNKGTLYVIDGETYAVKKGK